MTALDLFPEARVDPAKDPDRRYTTPETMHLCMRLAGVERWDLDVAADEESHWADRWYGVEHNGLIQPWIGAIWCNPPFSDLEPWLKRAWEAVTLPESVMNAAECVAMILPANRTEQPWWHKWVEPMRDRNHNGAHSPFRQFGDQHHRYARLNSHFLPSRVRYGHPGNPKGVKAESPPFASMLLVWRRA